MNAGISTITRGFVKKKYLSSSLNYLRQQSASQVLQGGSLLESTAAVLLSAEAGHAAWGRELSDPDEGLECGVTVFLLLYFCSLPRTCSKGRIPGAGFGRRLCCALYPTWLASCTLRDGNYASVCCAVKPKVCAPP